MSQSRGAPRIRDFGSRGRGRGRGRGDFQGRSRPDYKPVPPYSAVNPGTQVSIVLKEDQSTGREVQGIVGDVLTSGNHPRGIKVRLTDGRVGRVQRLGSSDPTIPSPAPTTLTEAVNGLSLTTNSAAREATGSQWRRGAASKDIRLDDESEAPREEIDLAAYIKPAKTKKGARKSSPEVLATNTVVTCPVCGKFEGDEDAVNHHVASHFEE